MFLRHTSFEIRGIPGSSDSKESACNAGDPGLTPGSGRSLQKGMVTYSCIFAWEISWTEEPGGLLSMRSQWVGHNWATNISTFIQNCILYHRLKQNGSSQSRELLLFLHFPTFWKWKSQSCSTLCDPMDCKVHGILQARILELVAFPFSRGSSQPRDQTQVSCIAGGFFTSWATREALILQNSRASGIHFENY